MHKKLPIIKFKTVIIENPVDGTEKNIEAINVIGNMAKPKNNKTVNIRASSTGDDQPSSWKTANVIISSPTVAM